MDIDIYWSKTILFLKSVGFRHFDEELDYDLDVYLDAADVIIMVEEEQSRKRIAVVLKPGRGFEVYVQINIASGFDHVHLLWNEITFDWLNHLKLAVQGKSLEYKSAEIVKSEMEQKRKNGIEFSKWCADNYFKYYYGFEDQIYRNFQGRYVEIKDLHKLYLQLKNKNNNQ